MHIDLNAFFARCEEIRNPAYEKLPLAIGNRGRRGIISTSNYEARKYGVKSAMPTFMAERKCANLVIVPPDFRLYKMMSNQFFSFIKRYSKIIEIVSIDECYVDMTEQLQNVKDIEGYLRNLQNRLFAETKLKCSIGIAPTKWLAKMASDLHKPMGITICRRKDIPALIYPLPIESFWGIGNKSAPKLRSYGINTIGDLAEKIDAKDEYLMSLLGKFYFTIKDWVKGYGSDTVDVEPWDPKSIGAQETLPFDMDSFDQVEETLSRIVEEISTRAKQIKKEGYTISLVIKDLSFKNHSRNVTLLNPTNDYQLIYSKASSLYKEHFEGNLIRLIGVTLSKLKDIEKKNKQLSLFDNIEEEDEDKTKQLIDSLNKKLKKNALKRASEVKR